jgi:hypothetical protein
VHSWRQQWRRQQQQQQPVVMLVGWRLPVARLRQRVQGQARSPQVLALQWRQQQQQQQQQR